MLRLQSASLHQKPKISIQEHAYIFNGKVRQRKIVALTLNKKNKNNTVIQSVKFLFKETQVKSTNFGCISIRFVG